jgi:hypothetical protein
MGMKPRVIGELPVTKQLQWQANCITKKFPWRKIKEADKDQEKRKRISRCDWNAQRNYGWSLVHARNSS